MATPLPARFGTLRIARVIGGTREATQVLALERSFAGMNFVMCANRRKCARVRCRVFARNLLALVASRFTRPAAARGVASANLLACEVGWVAATIHSAAVFAAW
jgi:hypothetical protein